MGRLFWLIIVDSSWPALMGRLFWLIIVDSSVAVAT
jgi:hypothetical protein